MGGRGLGSEIIKLEVMIYPLRVYIRTYIRIWIWIYNIPAS